MGIGKVAAQKRTIEMLQLLPESMRKELNKIFYREIEAVENKEALAQQFWNCMKVCIGFEKTAKKKDISLVGWSAAQVLSQIKQADRQNTDSDTEKIKKKEWGAALDLNCSEEIRRVEAGDVGLSAPSIRKLCRMLKNEQEATFWENQLLGTIKNYNEQSSNGVEVSCLKFVLSSMTAEMREQFGELYGDTYYSVFENLQEHCDDYFVDIPAGLYKTMAMFVKKKRKVVNMTIAEFVESDLFYTVATWYSWKNEWENWEFLMNADSLLYVPDKQVTVRFPSDRLTDAERERYRSLYKALCSNRKDVAMSVLDSVGEEWLDGFENILIQTMRNCWTCEQDVPGNSEERVYKTNEKTISSILKKEIPKFLQLVSGNLGPVKEYLMLRWYWIASDYKKELDYKNKASGEKGSCSWEEISYMLHIADSVREAWQKRWRNDDYRMELLFDQIPRNKVLRKHLYVFALRFQLDYFEMVNLMSMAGYYIGSEEMDQLALPCILKGEGDREEIIRRVAAM